MLWPLYRSAAYALTPVAARILRRRARGGREDASRLGERWGRASLPRPPGTLVWLHAASVGESLSLLPLIERLTVLRPRLAVLVTTGTVTSARIMADRLPGLHAVHQYLPLDHPSAIARFLDHWRPSLAVWVESELWPNLIFETRRRGIRMALVNARLSERSLRGWARAPRHLAALLGCFDLVLAQDQGQAAGFAAAGVAHAATVGDLKAAVLPKAPPSAELAALRRRLEGRPVWLAASTHAPEEEAVGRVHGALRRDFPDLLTILAPRHPARGDQITEQLAAAGYGIARRSAAELPSAATDIWMIDTLGELELFYPLAGIVLVAGSLGPRGSVGGHNPMEAASFGCAILHGPDTANCANLTRRLDEAGAAILIADEAELTSALQRLLSTPAERSEMGRAARAIVEEDRTVLDAVMDRLARLLPATPSHPAAA